MQIIGVYLVSKMSFLGLIKVLVFECFFRNVCINGLVLGVIKIRFSE